MWIKYNGCEETEQHICDMKNNELPVLILKHDVHIYLKVKDTGKAYHGAIIRACPYCGESFKDYC